MIRGKHEDAITVPLPYIAGVARSTSAANTEARDSTPGFVTRARRGNRPVIISAVDRDLRYHFPSLVPYVGVIPDAIQR